jgi:nicotinamidase-related amidase
LRGWLRTDAAIFCKQTSNNRTRFWEETLLLLTILDPNTALIVVHLQNGIVGSSLVHPIAGVIARTRALIDAFRAQELPVVLVNVAGRAPGRTEQPPRLDGLSEAWADLIPELDPQPGDIIVTKRTWRHG